MAELHAAKAARKPGPKAKATVGAPPPGAQPPAPATIVPQPSEDQVAAVLGVATPAAGYTITDQTDVTAETLIPPALSPQAQQIQTNVAAIQNGQLPGGAGLIPGAGGWNGFTMPVDNRDAAFYRQAFKWVGSLPELFNVYNEMIGRGITDATTLPQFYETWIEKAASAGDIVGAVEHSKQTGFKWPHPLVTRGQARHTELSTQG
jgi:hypothetical protein